MEKSEFEEISDFELVLKKERDLAYSINKHDIISKDDKCKIDLDLAITHAACLQIIHKKLEESSEVYLSIRFSSNFNSFILTFNNKDTDIDTATDNINIWRATTAITNTRECALTVAETLAVMLTVLGKEVYIDSKEPFNPLIQGKHKNLTNV